MAKYRVLVILMTIKGNKTAKHNDIVDESQLNAPAFELVKDGFVELVDEASASSTAQTQEETKQTEPEPTKDTVLVALKNDYLEAVKVKADLPKDKKAKDLASAGALVADLKAKLVEAGVEFDDNGDFVNSPVNS